MSGEASKIIAKYPGHIPVICTFAGSEAEAPVPAERDQAEVAEGKRRRKLLVPMSMGTEEFVGVVRSKCSWASEESRVQVGDKILPVSCMVSELYDQYKGADGFLHTLVSPTAAEEPAKQPAKEPVDIKQRLAKLRKHYPNQVPILVQQDAVAGLPKIDRKLLAPKDMTCAGLQGVLPKYLGLAKDAPEVRRGLRLIVAGKAIPDDAVMRDVFEQHASEEDAALRLSVEVVPAPEAIVEEEAEMQSADEGAAAEVEGEEEEEGEDVCSLYAASAKKEGEDEGEQEEEDKEEESDDEDEDDDLEEELRLALESPRQLGVEAAAAGTAAAVFAAVEASIAAAGAVDEEVRDREEEIRGMEAVVAAVEGTLENVRGENVLLRRVAEEAKARAEAAEGQAAVAQTEAAAVKAALAEAEARVEALGAVARAEHAARLDAVAEAEAKAAVAQARLEAVEEDQWQAVAEAEARAVDTEAQVATIDSLKLALLQAEDGLRRATEEGDEMAAQLQVVLDQRLALKQEVDKKSQEAEMLHLHIAMKAEQLHKKEAELQEVSEQLRAEREHRSSLDKALVESDERAGHAESAAVVAKACSSNLQQQLQLQVAEKVEVQKQLEYAHKEAKRVEKRLAVLEEAEAKREEAKRALVAKREEVEADGFVMCEWQDVVPDDELTVL